MPNTNLTVDWIGNEALRLAHEKLQFIGSINREFDSSFKPGYGNAIRIRVPSQYSVTNGRVIDVQDSVEQSTSITVATQTHVALRYNSQEMAQDLVNFQKLHLEPAMAQLASDVENTVLTGCTRLTFQNVGTAGTAISSLQVPGLARARLNQQLAPKSNRSIVMDSVTMADLVHGFAAYFNPSNAISEQYREGLVARTSMADYYESERVLSLANSAVSTLSTMSTYTITEGDIDIIISTNVTTPTTGMTLTIGHTSTGGIFACHPETKAAYGHLQTFTVLAGSNSTLINISPTIRITGPRKNVCRANGDDLIVSSLTTALVTFTGAANSTYPTPLMYHRDAFTFATAALPLMDDAIRCVVKTYDGVSLRVWEASDIRNDEKLTRIDILYGYAAIRPQWACRMIGTGT